MILRRMRLDRGWSQEQLSELSGVSTRTIQRLENGRKASLESLKCLAAVFETEITHLQKEPEMTPDQTSEPLSSDDRAALSKMKEWMQYDDDGYIIDPSLNDAEREALKQVRKLRGFYGHLAAYIAVVLTLLFINLLTSPGYLWFIWTALGWGVGLVIHAVRIFNVVPFLGADWEKKQVEKRLRRK